jgi:hypothetical protein
MTADWDSWQIVGRRIACHFIRFRQPKRSPYKSHHHYLRRIAPGAHDAFQADGADADPHYGAGRETA